MTISYYFKKNYTNQTTIQKIKNQFIKTLKSSKYKNNYSIIKNKYNINNIKIIH